MTNRGLATVYVNSTIFDSGEVGNMYFKNNVIYSYGSHFPMAYKTGIQYMGVEVVLFTTRGYSMTTSKHLSITRGALSNFYIIDCDLPEYLSDFMHGGLSYERKQALIKEIEARVSNDTLKASRARKEGMKEWYLGKIAEWSKQLSIALQFPLRPNQPISQYPF